MTQLLISVRSADEALLAARHGADLIDCKDPHAGALGGLPPPTIFAIVQALRAEGSALPVSATIGDWVPGEPSTLLPRVRAAADAGADVVKVGIEAGPAAQPALDLLATCGHAVAPVFIADAGLDLALIERAASRGFAALMVDTADKRAGSLFDAVPMHMLQAVLAIARRADIAIGLAGALRLQHVHTLHALAPDFAGFRGAVCEGDRATALDPRRLRALVAALREGQASGAGASPSSIERMRAMSSR